MAVLTLQQRNTLESAVKKGRQLAESGALEALKSLAVPHAEPFPHMDAAQRALRNSLRSKARLLGDERADNGAQGITHLAYELAYETWHKMLFARFLEANGLLMYEGVPITMDECEELAAEEGYADKWDAAAHYAARMLPAIFRPSDPLLQVPFAPNDRLRLEDLIAGLDEDIFTADDALGWVYQFWQSEAKDRINKSGDKIDGEKLPAVTQLFTEPYMVHFLIDNTLGAWWVSRHPGVTPPVKFEYLRLMEDGTPAAGRFESWPDLTAEVTTLDPCMGSGHFVAALFLMLAPLRMHEEGLSREAATDKVIAENLHGLELDPRCTQIAAFNLALTAWKFCGGYKELPEMNLACSGVAPKGKVEDWVKLVSREQDSAQKQRLANGMKELYAHFQLAPELGSLLDPSTIKGDPLYTASFDELQPVLRRALENEADDEELERGVVAAGIAKAGQLLSRRYVFQITNVPYLGKGKFDKVLNEYVMKHYVDAKSDLATVFLERLFKTAKNNGTIATVIPQNWLFLTAYKKYREKLLKREAWNSLARLGSGAFSQISGEVVKAILITLSRTNPTSKQEFIGIDVSHFPNARAKDEALKCFELKKVRQLEQLNNPDARVVMEEIEGKELLSDYAVCIEGLSTGDLPRFVLKFWEFKHPNKNWQPFIQNEVSTKIYSARQEYIFWENGIGQLHKSPSAHNFPPKSINGIKILGNQGIRITQMGDLPCTIYTGEIFGKNGGTLVCKESEHLSAIWCYCTSDEYKREVRKIDQSLAVTVGSMIKVPFDLAYWQHVASERYPNGLPKPYSSDPTQWLFYGHPANTDQALQTALARLLGYRWPAETDTEMELAYEARELITTIKALDHFTDEDGIFCIPSVNGESSGADRLREYLQEVWDTQWNNGTLAGLLKQEGATATGLEAWLRNEFFAQHCKLFQNRPFIWHIWDGRKDGFSVLVNYHKLTKENLSRLIYTYLADWMRQCEAAVRNGEGGADGLLQAARQLKEKLERILEGEAPYDIFVRWKPLEKQPIGWEPDLNDGVRLNIRPFMEADVLRKKPNIKWGIDRGKNLPGAPWGEVRDNDRHLTLEEKRNARKQ